MFSWTKKQERLVAALRAELKEELARHEKWLGDSVNSRLTQEREAHRELQVATRTELAEISEKLAKLMLQIGRSAAAHTPLGSVANPLAIAVRDCYGWLFAAKPKKPLRLG